MTQKSEALISNVFPNIVWFCNDNRFDLRWFYQYSFTYSYIYCTVLL